MLSLDAADWKNLDSGYRIPYDVSVPLKSLQSKNQPDEKIWNELWENLYHQGDVGTASYATIPEIFRIYKEKEWLDYHLPSLAAAVEEARLYRPNPELPDWLKNNYFSALQDIACYCLSNAKKLNDKNFSRAMILLTAILLREKDVYDLLEGLSIGDEVRVLEMYNEIQISNL